MSNQRSHIRLFDGSLIRAFPVRDIWIEEEETGKWPFCRTCYTLYIDCSDDPPKATRWAWEFTSKREAETAQDKLVNAVMACADEFGIKIPSIVLTPTRS